MTGAGVTEATEALLRSGATQAVRLQMAAPAMADAVTEQLGLEAPSFTEVSLAPVAVLAATGSALGQRELIVGARAVAVVAGDTTAEAGERLFREAAGVLIGDEQYTVLAVTAESLGTEPYCFRIQVRRAQP